MEALSASKEIILCESLIDALTFWCAGHRNVTASYGIQGFKNDHLEAFQKYATGKVLIAYDRDDGGEKAAEELAPKLAEAGIDVYRIHFPRGLDANEYAKKVTPASESLGVLIRSAAFLLKGKREVAPTPPEPEPEPTSSPFAARLLKVKGDQAEIPIGDRSYRIRGLSKNLSYDQLRVNVRVFRDEKVHIDTFDFLSARQRQLFIKQAADELSVKGDVIKKDLANLLRCLEEEQDRRIEEAMKPKEKRVEIPPEEKAEAMALLKDPNLLDRIVSDFETIGVIGEETNKLVGYLAAVSRKMDTPLALLIQSNSAAGKSALMDAILSLCPEEDVERFTAMTGQSLYYMSETDLRHKILAIAEVEGVERAGYAIKTLQSEGKISIATPVKDPETGEMKTKRHEV